MKKRLSDIRSNGSLGKTLFSYEGPAYNRPCGHGICFGATFDSLEDAIPEGMFFIKIVARELLKTKEDN